MKFRIAKKDLYTVPNILCYFRILLVPVFMVVYLTADGNAVQHYLAVGIILLAGLTDFLDGFIARRFNQITELGKLIDPLGDKLMQLAIAVVLVLHYDYLWILLAVFLVKEISMLVADLILFPKGVKLDGAKWYGKLSTFVFYIVMSALLILDTAIIDFAQKEIVIYALMGISVFFLLQAFVLYIPVFIGMFRRAFGKGSAPVESGSNDAAAEAGRD